MTSELIVIVRDEEKMLKKSHLLYDAYSVSDDDDTVKECVQKTLKEFNGKPDKISVRIKLEIE